MSSSATQTDAKAGPRNRPPFRAATVMERTLFQ